jgi:multiple sugar transport system substrate-binding protein
MKQLATSPAADPSLPVQMEDSNRLAMESGTAAFELNYPFVYPSMQKNKPDLAPNFKWAPYPAVTPGQPAKVTIGGINIAVSQFTKHPDQAFAAALCLRDSQNQKIGAIKGGTPPSLSALYDDPELQQSYPFAKEIQESLGNAAVRPLTPAYQNLSIVISHAVSPPAGINPESTEKSMASDLKDALDSKGVIP